MKEKGILVQVFRRLVVLEVDLKIKPTPVLTYDSLRLMPLILTLVLPMSRFKDNERNISLTNKNCGLLLTTQM